MAEEYPVLQELETKLKLQWIDTDDYLATQRAIIEVTPDHAYLELPRGRKGDKGDPGNAISFQGIVARTSDLPTGLGASDAAKAWVNTATKALHVWNGDQWFTVDNFAGVDADVQKFSQWFAHAADAARTALDAAGRAEYWANETIQQVTGDFATRNYVDAAAENVKWYRGYVSDIHVTLNDLGNGHWAVAGRDHAKRFGLPEEFGSIQMMQIGSSRSAFFLGQDSGLWTTVSRGTTWDTWRHVSYGGSQAGVSVAGLKTVPVAVSTGAGGTGELAGRYRVLTQIAAPVTRFRVHFSTAHPVWEGNRGTSTLGNVYIGHRTGESGIASQLTLKTGDSTVAAGGEWVSSWIRHDLSKETLIDFTVSAANAYNLIAPAWKQTDTSWAQQTTVPLWVWLEVETYSHTPTVALVGDSTGAGSGSAQPVWDSMLHIHGRREGFLPVLYASSGDLLEGNVDPEDRNYTRWAGFGPYDSVIIQAGSNDLHNGYSLATMQANYLATVDAVKQLSSTVIAGTVKPRYPAHPEYDSTRVAYNSWLKTQPGDTRDVVDFSVAVAPTGSIDPADNADGAHLTSSGHHKLAAALVGVPLAQSISYLIDGKADVDAVEAELAQKANKVEADTYGGFQPASVSVDTLLAGGTSSNSRVYYQVQAGGDAPNGDAGIIDVTNNGYQFIQVFYSATNNSTYQRTITDRSHIVEGQWIFGEWQRQSVDNKSRMASGEARRAAVVEAGLKRRGGVVGTGGKPAIALRFDHHLAQFGDKVLPLLKQYRLPWGQVINAGNIGKGNDTWTWTQLATECHNSGGEVWNHALTHGDVNDEFQADQAVTLGLSRLRENLPSLWVDSWAPPGQSNYMGFVNQDSPEEFYETYPGKLVLAQHAFVRGYYPGPHHPLNGQNLIGQSHVTMDSQSAAWCQAAVRSARDTGSGLTMMLHPNYLDQPGYMTTSELEQVLSYIAQRRDAGEIVVLSNAGILMADSSVPVRQTNMLSNAGAGEVSSSWSESVTSRSYSAHLGVSHEAEAWVKGSGQVALRVAVASPTNPVTSEHTVTLGSAAQRLSTLVTPPLDTTGITVSLTGNVRHTGITYRPI